ncbi:hypothetical protein CYLTODRAFT_441418 [Cylindrobasidium torrendii FP15055 ss-10]|uniref:Uncharacterized protein n=1 Tax=Cylindrobasidium torrendii FP15055 ss-10 TaxID=1314674 RepID=A0A0D7BLW5_9AGAR|nr:hypothetical protein CYLTODRAFT_441418 [Cylindrobasidium torrendii FP15055 ss-10]
MTTVVPANTFPDANTQLVLSAFKDSFTAIITLQIFGSVLWAIYLVIFAYTLRILLMEAIMAIRGALGSREMTWAARVDDIVKIMYLPVFLLVVSFAFGMVTVACWSPDAFGSNIRVKDAVCASEAFPAGWAFSFLANIITTFLIALKAWRHRNFIKTTVGRRQRSLAEKVMLLLVESGALYNLVWIAQIFQFPFVKAHLDMANPTVYIVTQTVAAIGYQLIGLYPTIIVLIVNRHSSITEVMDTTLSFRIASAPSSRISLNGVANTRG